MGGVDVPGAETDSPDADAMDGSAGPSSDTASTYRKKEEREIKKIDEVKVTVRINGSG